MGNDMETRLSKAEQQLADISTQRATERRELTDVLERIFSRLNDLHTRITVQQEYNENLKLLRARIETLEANQHAVYGGWKALGVVSAAAIAVGGLIAWIIDHAPRLAQSLTK